MKKRVNEMNKDGQEKKRRSEKGSRERIQTAPPPGRVGAKAFPRPYQKSTPE